MPVPELDPEVFFLAAHSHGEDTGEPDHEVGDLQNLFRAAYGQLGPEQQGAFFAHPVVRLLLSTAGIAGSCEANDICDCLRVMLPLLSDVQRERFLADDAVGAVLRSAFPSRDDLDDALPLDLYFAALEEFSE